MTYYDIILREWNGEWMGIVEKFEGRTKTEIYVGEYQDTPEQALTKCRQRLDKIKGGE